MRRYNPKEIEPKWQQSWAAADLYAASDDDTAHPKFVMLTEFPYPSGDGLHIGHVREYTYGDILSRFKRMQGFNVMYPMGWDAFGLPTENFAIKKKVAPQVVTAQNVANFKVQMTQLGLSFDWSREINTTDPTYYKWTQWLFLQFYKQGLAYQQEIAINWCPHCKTGLANEEVVNGRHERCDTLVEKKLLKQWLLKITEYADRLIEGLQDVDYPSRIADQQINWIGRSEGAEIDFVIQGEETVITAFTTRKDTIPGVTFIVVAPESPLLDQLTDDEHRSTVHAYRKQVAGMTDIQRQESKEKTGVFTGKHAINPFSGQPVPIYAADYVLANYGTGVVMGMGGHDERDREFSLRHNLPIILTTEVPAEYADLDAHAVYNGPGKQINSGAPYDGLPNKEAGDKIFAKLQDKGVARPKKQYKLRDWIFSRQHYWGEPIPIIHCESDGAVPVPEDQLPVTLPEVEHYEPTDTGESPLAAITDWVETTCPVCGGPAKRETDTMPNWAGSSWYYLRYFDPKDADHFAARAKLDHWQDVDLYLGGMEHTTLHLLYSRFWHQFLYDQGLVPTPEPYKARRGQGIILAADGSKMSKSKGNVINPSEVIDSGYGADALRMAIAFLAPYDQTTPWNPESVAGTYRFLQRVWTLVYEFLAAQDQVDEAAADTDTELALRRLTGRLVKKVGDDMAALDFNTAIAAMMEAVNELYKLKAGNGFTSQEWEVCLETLVQVLAPYAPHVADELWHELGHENSIHQTVWPEYDAAMLVDETINLAVQVNGKLRDTLRVAKDAPQAEVEAAAAGSANVQAHLASSTVVKVIYVPGRILNYVVK